jgi:hypothetical protein
LVGPGGIECLISTTPDAPWVVLTRFQTKIKQNQTFSNEVKQMSNVFKHEDGESPLIPLLKNKKTAFEDGSIMRLLRRDFDIVCQARSEGLSWAEIARAFGFEGKAAQARYAFFYEKKRREKKGIKAPEKNGKEVMPAAPAKTQKEPTVFRSEDKQSARSAPTGGVVTGTKTPDPKEAEPSGSRWREIKY